MNITMSIDTKNIESIKEAFELISRYIPDELIPKREPIMKAVLLSDTALPTRIVQSLRSFGIKTLNELKELELGKSIQVPQKKWNYDTKSYDEGKPIEVKSLDDLGRYARNFGPNSLMQIKKYVSQII